MQIRTNVQIGIFATITVVLGSLLFIGGPQDYNGRIIKEVWNSGHAVLFAILTFGLLSYTPLKNSTLTKKIVFTILFSLILGLITEVVQFLIGRSLEVRDLVNDLLGGLAGLAFSIAFNSLSRAHLLSGMFAGVILSLVGIRGFIFSTIDEFRMSQEFPLLSGFESFIELDRWDFEHAEISLSNQHVSTGAQSMRVEFLPGKYPFIRLDYFERDWRNKKSISFDIYSESENSVNMVFKVYDLVHLQSGYYFNDRFNERFTLLPGKNHFSFELADIQSSPLNRQMDMSEIIAVSLFTTDLKQPLVFYIDSLMLSDNQPKTIE